MRLVFIGILIVLSGLAFAVIFAGIPYQDPTVEQQTRWEGNHFIADGIMLVGALTFLTGLAKSLLLFLKKRRR